MPEVDELLKVLAAVSADVTAAEGELDEGNAGAAGQRIDEADRGLAGLRARWPELGEGQRRVLGAAAAPVRARLDEVKRRMPRRAALSEGPRVEDPEQDEEPGAA